MRRSIIRFALIKVRVTIQNPIRKIAFSELTFCQCVSFALYVVTNERSIRAQEVLSLCLNLCK